MLAHERHARGVEDLRRAEPGQRARARRATSATASAIEPTPSSAVTSRAGAGDERQPHGGDHGQRPLASRRAAPAGRSPRCPSRARRAAAARARRPAPPRAPRPARASSRGAAPAPRPRPSRPCRRSSPRRAPRSRRRAPARVPRSAAASVAGVTPAPTVTCRATASTGPIAVSRASESTTSPPRGTPPPTSPVFPPCGHDRGARRRAGRQHRGDLLHRARPHDRRRRAAEAARDVALVARLAREDVRGADRAAQGVEQARSRAHDIRSCV